MRSKNSQPMCYEVLILRALQHIKKSVSIARSNNSQNCKKYWYSYNMLNFSYLHSPTPDSLEDSIVELSQMEL